MTRKGRGKMTPLLEEYYEHLSEPPQDQAKKILFAVIDDIQSRRGFNFAWQACDEDTLEEILQTNLRNIQDQMS